MTRPLRLRSAQAYAEVIGDPIAHSKSPLIHTFWLQKLGIDAEYRACHVHADELDDYFARRREDAKWRGCNVTIPHKVSVTLYADAVNGGAELVGATNCLYPVDGMLVAENTDPDGISSALGGIVFPVCLIGSGGAARALLSLLVEPLAHKLRILARDNAKARAMLGKRMRAASVFSFDHADQALENANTIVNATSLGMSGHPEMPLSVLEGLARVRDAQVLDMVYSPLETQFLMAARAAKLEVHDGLEMLVGQAAEAFRLFFGQSAPREHDAELRALLVA